jgi:hypothetical protein
MRVGEFQCIFGSDQAVVKLKFRERISAHEEPDKLQYSLFVSHLASMSMYIVSHLLNSFQSTRGGMCSFLDCTFFKFGLHNLPLGLHILVGLHA